jgi:hypothetical protein
MNAKERTLEFIKYKGIGQGAFEKVVGISNGYINNNKGTIGSDILNSIITAYPELNLYWLITGEGEMLKSKETQESVEMVKLQMEIKNLNSQLAREKELVSQLMGKIEPINKQPGKLSEAQTDMDRGESTAV